MKLGHHLVDVGRKSKAPVDVVLVSVETTFFPNLSELLGKVVVVVGDAESDAQIAFVADLVALVGDPDLEVAKVLVLVRLERWFTEDFTQDLPGDLVAFTSASGPGGPCVRCPNSSPGLFGVSSLRRCCE